MIDRKHIFLEPEIVTVSEKKRGRKPKEKKRIVDETNNCCRSRGRGYSFEASLVKRFKATRRWDARRLGGSSTGLPDIVAIYADTEIMNQHEIIALEAKSGTKTVLEVPEDQVRRCFTTINLFQAYEGRCVVFAFKFSQKKRVKKEFEMRKLKEYYVLISAHVPELLQMKINHVWCNYDGKVRIRVDDEQLIEDYYDVFDSFGGLLKNITES